MINQTISHYTILEKLGEGGMGVVYKAHDTKLDRDVALKFLPSSLTISAEDIKRFELEAKAISALNHPNIATIHDVDEVSGQKYIVLEYIPGGTLKSKLKRVKSEDREFSISDIVEYGIQIAEALTHAHRHQIIHRDVKTDNLMLTEEGKVKLTDFGLAKLRGSVQITKTGRTIGTVAYMSPEQLRGEEVDQRSDIFSFGVVLYELTTLHLPFRGEFETAVSYSVQNENPPSVKSLRKDLPSDLEDVINCCLEKDKTKRYQSADDIIVVLKKIQRKPTGNVAKVTKVSKAWWMAALFIAIIMVVGLYLFYQKSGPTSANRKTIAVLPFENMSGNKEEEYFSDGITEDILMQLSKIADLNVISRTSVMQYKGTKKTVREIGKELNAGVLLEGSVRRSGNRIRIVGQLIDAEADKHLWAESYDRDMRDVFAIQSEVAREIGAALKVKLTPKEKEYIENKPTDNTDAYNYYLRGREYYYRYKKQDNEEAIELFKKAIAIDPKYAMAWAGLGDAYAQRVIKFGFHRSWVDSSLGISKKAISLDSTSAEAYKALGLSYGILGFIDSNMQSYSNALKLNPNLFTAMTNLGGTYLYLGELYKGLQLAKKAAVIAPTQPTSHAGMGVIYRLIGESERAEREFKIASDLQFDNGDVYVNVTDYFLMNNRGREANNLMSKLVALNSDNSIILERAGDVAAMTGDFPKAREYYQRSLSIQARRETTNDSSGGIMLGYILVKEGKRNQAEKILEKQKMLRNNYLKNGGQGPGAEYHLSLIYAIQGNKKEAFTHLQRAIDRGSVDYQATLIDPEFENIRNDEEFKKLITQMKAKVDEQKSLIEAMEKEGNQ